MCEVFCKRCNGQNIRKNGRRSISQVYKCKDCNCTFTKYDGRSAVEKARKRIAILMAYEELKLSLFDIANLCKLKKKTIERWIERERDFFENDELKENNHYFESIKEILKKKKEREEKILLKKKEEEYIAQETQKQKNEYKKQIQNALETYPFLTKNSEFWSFHDMDEMHHREGRIILPSDDEIENFRRKNSLSVESLSSNMSKKQQYSLIKNGKTSQNKQSRRKKEKLTRKERVKFERMKVFALQCEIGL